MVENHADRHYYVVDSPSRDVWSQFVRRDPRIDPAIRRIARKAHDLWADPGRPFLPTKVSLEFAEPDPLVVVAIPGSTDPETDMTRL